MNHDTRRSGKTMQWHAGAVCPGILEDVVQDDGGSHDLHGSGQDRKTWLNARCSLLVRQLAVKYSWQTTSSVSFAR